MLGDFLRNLREMVGKEWQEVDLGDDIPLHHRTPALASLAQWTDEDHAEVLREAALTGAQLLGAGEREA
jgi:hypothetical protein